MKATDTSLLPAYYDAVGKHLPTWFEAYDLSKAQADLDYLTQASAVYSANIEGNSVDLNAFMNSLTAAKPFKPSKEMQEIKDLVAAYEFAKNHELTEKHFLKAHQIMSKTLLVKAKQGKYRNDRMGVFDETGLVYLAIEPENVATAMWDLFVEIGEMQTADLSLESGFYHASLVHLRLAHIHPFWDGNGRMARLLEKWILSSVLNGRAWALQSERYYKQHLSDYYRNINLGVNYYELDYGRSLPFLTMLAESLKQN